jgi:murein L,D-transpeptidase YafK
MTSSGWLITASLLFAGTSLGRSAAAADGLTDPCAELSFAHVVVRTEEHRLYLCAKDRTVVSSYPVRLARNGVGKTRAGDGKVPIGTYPLGRPRPSKKYGTFVPIGFPLPEQQRRGYTGGDVGIHGPDRRVRWLGRLVNTFDTTDGCVGVASDREMDEIAAWLRRKAVDRIVLVER